MYRALVMLSSYNGEKYLKEQLDSILRQKNVQIECLIRDDGSTDKTLDILTEYQAKFSNIKFMQGKNIGWRRSFMELLYHAGEYPFYCFSDQDDIWEENKVYSAIISLERIETPALYYSSADLINEKGNTIEKRHGCPPVLDKRQVLVQNFCQGCTMVFNRKLKELCGEYRLNNNIAHDIWIPIVAVYFGAIIYDKNAYLSYRQHSDNLMGGIRTSWIKQFIKRKESIKTGENYYTLALELLNAYRTMMTESDREFLSAIIRSRYSVLKRMYLLLNPYFVKRTFKGTLYLKLLILTNAIKNEH